MTDDAANIISGHLRRFDTRFQRLRGGIQHVKKWLAAVQDGQVRINRRRDRIEARVEKIERRLDPVEG